MEPVRSSRNQRVAEAIRLHRARRRAQTGLTLLEGPLLIEEARAAGARLESVFVAENDAADAGRRFGSCIVVTSDVMKRLAGTRTPRGPVAVLVIPPSAGVHVGSVVVLWGVGDPGNAGTLIRTAAAFGLGVVVGPGSVDPWSPKVLRAGAGGHFRTSIDRRPELLIESLKAEGFTVAASIARGGEPPGLLRGMEHCALLVGDETGGLPEDVVASSDVRITIPMPGGTESLNASVAGSLLAYELAGRSNGAPGSPD